MAWTAKITNVEQELEKNNQVVIMTIVFQNTTDARTHFKKYKLWVDGLQDTTLATLKAEVEADKARLDKLDAVYNTLVTKIGIVF